MTSTTATRATWPVILIASVALPGCADRTSLGPGDIRASTQLGLSGPPRIAPGDIAAFTASTVSSDGSRVDVSLAAEWRTSSEAVLTITGPARATGKQAGEAVITASYGGRSTDIAVLVLPTGTSVLKGFISEVWTGTPIPSARVEVISGSAIVLDTTTAADGRYQLYGLPPNAGLRVSKQDYLTQEIDSVRPPAQDVRLVRHIAPGSYSGTYNLELEIGGCGLPEDASKRSYTATIQGSDPIYLVTLSGADFMPGCGSNSLAPGLLCNQFTAQAAGDELGFAMMDFDWGDGGQITELLPDGGRLSVVAWASARRDGSSLYGTGTGDVSYCARAGETRWACATTPNNCRSSNVQLRFTRR